MRYLVGTQTSDGFVDNYDNKGDNGDGDVRTAASLTCWTTARRQQRATPEIRTCERPSFVLPRKEKPQLTQIATRGERSRGRICWPSTLNPITRCHSQWNKSTNRYRYQRTTTILSICNVARLTAHPIKQTRFSINSQQEYMRTSHMYKTALWVRQKIEITHIQKISLWA